ncbi:MAG: class B sortase [Tenericutes bacterium]|nr:class B sortase [Mycoplasmatota bacterium]
MNNPKDNNSDIEIIDKGKVIEEEPVVNEYTMVIYPEVLKKAKIKALSKVKLNKEVADDIRKVVQEEFNDENINYSLKKVENIKFSSAKINMLNPPKKYKQMIKIKHALRNSIAIICLIVAGFILNIVYNYYEDQKEAKIQVEELKNRLESEYSEISNISLTLEQQEEVQAEITDTKMGGTGLNNNESFKYYHSKNSDTVGYLEIKNTDISYPVVQASDNKYYLNNGFYKQSTSAGWIFADYRNAFPNLSQNTIIYGHNLKGTDIMFGTLKKTLTDQWLNNKDNHFIKFNIKDHEYRWQVFSIYTTTPDFNYIDVSFTKENFTSFTQKIKGMSVRFFDVSIDQDDKILTLSTCYTSTKRLVLHAKLID